MFQPGDSEYKTKCSLANGDELGFSFNLDSGKEPKCVLGFFHRDLNGTWKTVKPGEWKKIFENSGSQKLARFKALASSACPFLEEVVVAAADRLAD